MADEGDGKGSNPSAGSFAALAWHEVSDFFPAAGFASAPASAVVAHESGSGVTAAPAPAPAPGAAYEAYIETLVNGEVDGPPPALGYDTVAVAPSAGGATVAGGSMLMPMYDPAFFQSTDIR